MKRTLPWAAVALACLLPTTSFAEIGNTVPLQMGKPICLEASPMRAIGELVAQGDLTAATVVLQKATAEHLCAPAPAGGMVYVVQVEDLGVSDNGVHLYLVEVTHPEWDGLVIWMLSGEPAKPEPSGWRI